MKPYYSIKAKGDEVTDVYIYDEIGEDWFGEGVVAKDFVRDFAAIKTPRVNLRINSPGGSVFDGQAIYNAIARHPAEVTAYIDGLAASISSIIPQAADKRVIAKNALMMIHNAWGFAMGNAKDMRDTADVLEKVDGTLVGIYEDKTGQPEEHIRAVMADETWFDADEAVAFGLADEVGDEMKVAAKFDLSRFKHPPVAIAAEDEPPADRVEEPEPAPVDHKDEPAPEYPSPII